MMRGLDAVKERRVVNEEKESSCFRKGVPVSKLGRMPWLR